MRTYSELVTAKSAGLLVLLKHLLKLQPIYTMSINEDV